MEHQGMGCAMFLFFFVCYVPLLHVLFRSLGSAAPPPDLHPSKLGSQTRVKPTTKSRLRGRWWVSTTADQREDRGMLCDWRDRRSMISREERIGDDCGNDGAPGLLQRRRVLNQELFCCQKCNGEDNGVSLFEPVGVICIFLTQNDVIMRVIVGIN